MAFTRTYLIITFTIVIVLGSTLTAASSSNLWDATLIYSKVATHIMQLLYQSSSNLWDATLLYSKVASHRFELLRFGS